MADNIHKSGSHKPNYRTMKAAKDYLNTPTQAQVKYRNALYKFLREKGLVQGLRLYGDKRGVSSNIKSFLSIIERHGLMDEWMSRKDERAGNEKNEDGAVPPGDRSGCCSRRDPDAENDA
jgi:hypothetical protein